MNKEYKDWTLLRQYANRYTWFRNWGIRDRLKQLAKHSKGKTLDIGWYQVPNIFLKNAVGLDVIVPKTLPQQYSKAYKLNLKDIYKYPFKDSSFDSVLAGEVIEHVPNLDAFMKEINRILKKGGVFVISTPNPASPVEIAVHLFKWIFGIDYDQGKKGEHVHEFLFTNMITLMNIYGFKVKKIRGTYIQIPGTLIQIPINIQPLTYCTIYIAKKISEPK